MNYLTSKNSQHLSLFFVRKRGLMAKNQGSRGVKMKQELLKKYLEQGHYPVIVKEKKKYLPI